jgi:23S rRNA (cytidine1920-2'-O)/16S rRNA (cytidine1409-2'-O)-methyltransferase
MSAKRRLDQELVQRGLFDSREKAQRAILAGQVRVNGQLWDKASVPCPPDAEVEVKGADKYVGRGGFKLEAALDQFDIDPAGLSCLDVGASTGGFTDCLLQRGAARVTAVDVGHGQLHWKLRQDPRVEVREGVNARFLTPEDFSERFPLAVMDLSFISLRKVIPAVLELLASGGRLCALIKPQFEAGPAQVGKGGIVREEAVRQGVVDGLLEWAESLPVRSAGVIPSPITGTDGNQEFLWCLEKK